MEAIHANQDELYTAILKLATNIKKDSADRKTVDYFRRRLENLNQYWSDYQYNHDRLLTEESKSHPYFTDRAYEKTKELYISNKAFINQQYQVLLIKMKEAQQGGSTQEEQGPAWSEQADPVGRQSPPVGVCSRGSSSKLDELLKKQASNFRALQRTVTGINLDLMSEKWELKDALRTLQSRWSIIDSLHWELDSELEGTNQEYEVSYTKQETIYNKLKNAINKKLGSVESSRKQNENSKPSTSKQNKLSSSNFKNKYSASKTSVNNIELTCPLCKESHGIYYCNKFLNMTPSSKRQAITRLQLCKNCLYSHGDKECTSEKRCRECRGKHNTLLHEAFNNKSSCNTIMENDTPAVLATRTQNQESPEKHVSQQGNNVIETLLATAMIKVQASDGSYHKMRALIDQGSQASLISARATQQLALSRKYCRAVICGIGEKESSSKGVTNITCCSHFNDFKFKTDVVIMDTLINQLPRYTFTKPTWAHLAGMQLADPEYNVSRPIDILLGADVYSHIILEGHIRVVTLKTKNGLIKRPILKLSILPVNDRIDKQELRSKEEKDGKSYQNKKVNYSFSSLVMLLLSFMSILTTAHCSYNITQLKDNQGLYFDKIANMQLIRDEWKIVTYYDMNSFWQGTEACSKYLSYLDQLCNKFKETSHCDVIQVQLQQEFSELEYYNHLLLSQHFSTRRAHVLRRRKRGFINGIGYLANSLFGVLDERFAEQYKQDIHSIHDNENHLLSLLKQQTTVIEAEYNVLKRNGQAINKQHKMLNTLSIKLDKMENVLLNESERNRAMNDFSTGAIATSNVLRQLKTIQTSLLDTITDVYHGRLNFHLLSPEQLKDTLNTISSHLSKDLTLPINNLQINFRNIYHLLTVKARMTEEFLIFELKLPLVSRDTFSIMKIIPIPQLVGNSSMATLTPIAEHVAINLKKDSYLPMSINDVQICLRDNVDNYLCQIEKPIYHLKNDEKLCEVEPDSSKCKISITTCSNQWTALSKINNYAFFCCSQCQIRVLCDNNVSPGQLVKAGILGVEHDCLIKTESFTVYSRNEGFSTLDIKPSFKLPEIEPINHIIDVGIPTPLIQNYTLLSSNQELDEIKKQLRILKASENLPNQLSYHDIHHYTSFYVVIGVVLVVGAGFMVRRLRNRRTASLEVARAAQHVTPARAEAGASISSSTVQYSVSARNQCEIPCVSDYSEIPKVHKLDKCTVPMSRKTEFK